MKKLISIAIITLIFISCNKFNKEERVLVKSETDSVTVFSVTKAGCKNCQKIIEGGLKGEKGVKQSILNLNTKEVSIVYNSEVISLDVLEKKVKQMESKIPCK